MSKQTPASDGLFRLKFIGYAWSQGLEGSDFDYDAFLHYAKFQLCEARGYLMQDPIWATYADEAILAEYYAMRCAREPKFREELAAQVSGNAPEREALEDWFKTQMERNRPAVEALRKARAKAEQESESGEFEFTPTTASTPNGA